MPILHEEAPAEFAADPKAEIVSQNCAVITRVISIVCWAPAYMAAAISAVSPGRGMPALSSNTIVNTAR
jgi:hypothetical protein